MKPGQVNVNTQESCSPILTEKQIKQLTLTELEKRLDTSTIGLSHSQVSDYDYNKFLEEVVYSVWFDRQTGRN